MNVYLVFGATFLLALLLTAIGWSLRRHPVRRSANLKALLDLADQLEADLKTCRNGLQQAYSVMSINPDHPAANEQDAQLAIDAGLRALLQQRLWIRDRSDHANQHELNQVTDSMREARTRLQPLLQALTAAQNDLNQAMRAHIQRDSDT